MKAMKSQYLKNKAASVGNLCKCPACGSDFTKKVKQQAFCSAKPGTECKDKYWNTVTPGKHNNTTRISPANARWQEKHAEIFNDFDDDMSWDAHKHD